MDQNPVTANIPKDVTTETPTPEVLLDAVADRDAAIKYQSHRHAQWTENYDLARDRQINNRILQRHPINFPLMKENETAWLSKVDELPDIYFECQDEDPEESARKELFINAKFIEASRKMRLPIMDYINKKSVYYTGRTFKKFNVENGKVMAYAMDTMDVVVDPKVRPYDIDSASHIHHLNIFKSLREIITNKNYDERGRKDLLSYLATNAGIVSASMAKDAFMAKMKRIQDVGVKDLPSLMATDSIVQLTETIKKIWNPRKEEFVFYVILYAFDHIPLVKKPLKEVMGVDFLPYTSWCANPDSIYFWEFGPGDYQRQPNKALNLWVSQMFENRTLRNYGMQYFDGTKKDFFPESFTPMPFGWYPVPGNPNDVVKSIEIKEMSESLDEMEYFRSMASRAMLLSDLDKGQGSKGSETLGEINLLATRSQRPVNNLAKSYRGEAEDFGRKWYELEKANAKRSDVERISKRGRSGSLYHHNMRPKDWIADQGYNIKVLNKKEKEQDSADLINKLFLLKDKFPGNMALARISERKIVSEIDIFTPEEIKDILAEQNTMNNQTQDPTNPIALPNQPKLIQ